MKRTATRCMFVVAVLAVLVPVLAEAAAKSPPLQLTVDLTDGSRVIGEPSVTSLPLRSEALGKIKIPLAKIRTIKFSRDHESVAVTMTNGDSVQGGLDDLSLKLRTVFGDITVPVEHATTISVSVPATEMTIPNSMVSYWSFDTQANPGTDNFGANNGTLYGPRWNDSGRANGALQFDGKDYVLVPDSASLQMSAAITVSAWFRLDSSADSYFNLVDKSGGRPYRGFRLYVLGDGYNGGNLVNGKAVLGFNVDIGNGDGGFALGSGDVVTIGQWHHAVGTYDGTTLKLYLDGQLMQSASAGTCKPIVTRNDPLYIGKNIFGWYWTGGIDEVAILNQALSASTIHNLYQQGLAGHGYAALGCGGLGDKTVVLTATDSSGKREVGTISLYARYYASKTISANGHARGHHMSGSRKRPRIHQGETTLSQEQLKGILQAAAALGPQVHALHVEPEKDWQSQGYWELRIEFNEGPPMQLCWARGGKPPYPKVQELVTLIQKVRVGAW